MSRLLALLVALLPLMANASDVQEGMWDIEVVMRVDGQDYGPYTRKQCITREDAQNPARLFAETTGNCEYTNRHFFGNQFSFNVHCNAGVPLTGMGEVEYGPDWVKGHMELNAQVPGGPSVETVSEVSGKRLGDCKQ